METSRIYKTLPNGKRVHRTVTREEYINDGWARNGWASNLLDWQQAADKTSVDKTFQETFGDKDTRTLDLYSRNVDITKQLPNGHWKKITIPYGQYDTQGWRTNGWALAGRLKRNHLPNTKRLRDDAIKRLKQQSWWKPTRSQDQARMLSTTKSLSDIAQLRNVDNIPNPKYRTWARRKTTAPPPAVINRFTGFRAAVPKLSKKNRNETYEQWALRHDRFMMKYNPYNFWIF